MAHLFISAAHKSSGKTLVGVGLCAAFAARGRGIQAFKKGPDYIDAMWLARASGRPCYNLDFNTQSEEEIRALFARHAGRADLAVIEGNKGLHDGLDLEGRDSSAALAKLLAAPVVIIIDTTGITRGVAPLVLGFQAFDPTIAIQGVILNRVAGARQESKLRQALERYTDVPVLGAIGRHPALLVKERHLGLTTPEETTGLDEVIDRVRLAVVQGVDLDRIWQLAHEAAAEGARGVAPDAMQAQGCLAFDGVSHAHAVHSRASECPPAAPEAAPSRRARSARATMASLSPTGKADVRIAVARDAAFGFYYPDDLEALEQAGAQLVFFNALRDTRLPDADGLFIGGGFPETQMDALAANTALRAQIRRAAENGLPIYAECGGLMYLTRSITWGPVTREMVGYIPAATVMHATPQGRGLVVLEETGASPWPPVETQVCESGATRLAAHEFHYAGLVNLAPESRFAYRMIRGHGIDGRHDGVVKGNVLASFSHLRSTARGGHWAPRFVAFVRGCKRQSRLPGAAVGDAG